MGQFCTRSICNIEKGDANYNKLTSRNMDKKPATNSSSVTPHLLHNTSDIRNMKSTTEPVTPITPECDVPNAAYTHSTPNTSSDTIHTSKRNSISKRNSRHVKIPTPSMQEIQHAMNNLHLWAANSEATVCDEEKAALPTMAIFDVSNLLLANPFGSPNPSIVNPQINDNKYAIPSILPNTVSNQSSNSNTTNINNINIITSINNPETILKAMKEINNNNTEIIPNDVAPPASIYGNNDSGTMVVHGDDTSAMQQLTLQQEGSSDVKDETNVVFSPPTISDYNGTMIDPIIENNPLLELDTNNNNNNNNNNTDIGYEQIVENKMKQHVKRGILKKTVSFHETVITENDNKKTNDSIWYDENDTKDGNNNVINKMNTNGIGQLTKHRKSNEIGINTIERMRLQLYDNTTIQSSDSSSDDDDENEDNDEELVPHKTLFNEKSNCKWKKKEKKQHQKMMEAEIKKLQMEQEIAEMNKAMTFYRQQTHPY